ncbi:colony stimulating factor 3 (granulocyte) a [Silurus asotus]|uniref:Colony stimulating factor 3 (Granulocyte) a n=1 Tax=Silurus asotus TaxID=30991 RepID=A0AAD5FJU2_SILAS|nr:colony stimulating factor 3 (granulocyte) a [Silurus asotus]
MYAFLGLCLALSAFGGVVLPLPVPQPQHTLDMEVTRGSDFQDAAEGALSLITKILGEIPAVHKSLIHIMTLSLNESDLSALQFLKESLGLPQPSPLQPISDDLTLETSLGRIAEGLKLHKFLLKVITEQVHFKSKEPSGILYDLRDTVLHVHKMQHLIKASIGPEKVSESQLREDLAPKLEKGYMSQVAAHLTIIQLREFAKDVSRSLQSMIITSVEQEIQDS